MNKKINTAKEAKQIVEKYLLENNIIHFAIGLPEIIDRYKLWQIPIIYKENSIGTIYLNFLNGEIDKSKSSKINVLLSRIKKINDGEMKPSNKQVRKNKKEYIISELTNTIILGNSEIALKKVPDQSIDMIFTSPPYYNAKKEYAEFDTYEDYLEMMRNVIKECKRVLIDGKFFIINSSHVLIPRTKRSESSKRIAVPFDLHTIFIEEGFEFVDDIIWQKPEGAGWASGRGRRFLMIECNKEYVEIMKKDTEKELNNLFNPTTYEYFDYSKEKENHNKEINLNKDIRSLKKLGLSEEDIHKYLMNMKKRIKINYPFFY